jgi:hypothetical protein
VLADRGGKSGSLWRYRSGDFARLHRLRQRRRKIAGAQKPLLLRRLFVLPSMFCYLVWGCDPTDANSVCRTQCSSDVREGRFVALCRVPSRSIVPPGWAASRNSETINNNTPNKNAQTRKARLVLPSHRRTRRLRVLTCGGEDVTPTFMNHQLKESRLKAVSGENSHDPPLDPSVFQTEARGHESASLEGRWAVRAPRKRQPECSTTPFPGFSCLR